MLIESEREQISVHKSSDGADVNGEIDWDITMADHQCDSEHYQQGNADESYNPEEDENDCHFGKTLGVGKSCNLFVKIDNIEDGPTERFKVQFKAHYNLDTTKPEGEWSKEYSYSSSNVDADYQEGTVVNGQCQ